VSAPAPPAGSQVIQRVIGWCQISLALLAIVLILFEGQPTEVWPAWVGIAALLGFGWINVK
jgi:hypothetical protein